MNAIVVWQRGLPRPARWALAGAAAVGGIGAIVGLIIGLRAYAPTAPFAVIELGLPAAIAGGLAGLVAGSIAPCATARARWRGRGRGRAGRPRARRHP